MTTYQRGVTVDRHGAITRHTPPYAVVPRCWPGETVVILGGGSSLTREDVEYVRGKARVIAIKEAIQLAPWADALYACDAKYWRFYHGVPEYAGPKYCLEPPDGCDPSMVMPFYPGLQMLRDSGSEGLERNPSALRNGSNSGYQAINLAVHCGVKKIVLLGFDMWRGPNGHQNWFGPHPNHVDTPYPILLQRFATIAAPLKAAGVEVINCSRFTVLSVFPRVPLEEAFA